jgi:hypothetical protein
MSETILTSAGATASHDTETIAIAQPASQMRPLRLATGDAGMQTIWFAAPPTVLAEGTEWHTVSVKPVTASVEMVLRQLGGEDLTLPRRPDSTTDAILQDPVWRQRIFASLDQVRQGQTRPIEEYLEESDAEDD